MFITYDKSADILNLRKCCTKFKEVVTFETVSRELHWGKVKLNKNNYDRRKKMI